MDQPSKQGLALQLGLHLLSGHRDRTFYPHSRIPYEVLAVDPTQACFATPQNKRLPPNLDLPLSIGVGETLPNIETGSMDAVVCTLTLCSITNPLKVVRECKRVLRDDDKTLFVEHVLSKEKTMLNVQKTLTPLQELVSDGCHLDRLMRGVIEAGEWSNVDAKVVRLDGFLWLHEVLMGAATKYLNGYFTLTFLF